MPEAPLPGGSAGSGRAAAILDGKAVSAELLETLKARIEREKLRPHLRVISVGEDPASKVFVKQKRLAAERVGIEFSQTCLAEAATLAELQREVVACNRDGSIHGMIVQLPLPAGLQEHEREVLDAICPRKDVDCFHPENYGRLAIGEPSFLPATPAGILRLLEHYKIETKGKLAVIVGKSNIVGKPLSLLLGNEQGPAATVVQCDQHTEGLWNLTRQADILVIAAGKHHLLHDAGAVRPDGQAVVIDVGIHRAKNAEGKMVLQGDVDAEVVRPRCRFLTPVPGGVGPMTVACLLEQVVQAASQFAHAEEQLRAVAAKEKPLLSSQQVRGLFAKLDPGLTSKELEAIARGVGCGTKGQSAVSLSSVVEWAFQGSEDLGLQPAPT